HDWHAAACAAVRECLSQGSLGPGDIACISIDGPAHAVALLGDDNEVIYPTIHSSDLRSTGQALALEDRLGQDVFRISGQRPNASWTLAHLAWLREQEPQVFARLRRIQPVKDYARARLTGDFVTDRYDAIGTQLFDLEADCWSDALCAEAGLPLAALPVVMDARDIAGAITEEGARATGLLSGTPVAVGSGDSVVEAFGVGVLDPGQATIKLATHANVNVVTAKPQPAPLLITYRHLLNNYGFSIAATNSGAASWRWFRETFARDEQRLALEQGKSMHTLASDMAAQAPPGCDGLLFHPYLMGERTPYWDSQLRASFVGVGAHHTLAHFARAVLEGVAFSLRDCLDAHTERINELRLIGGGAKSAVWRRILCDVIGRPMLKPAQEDASFGAAMVAGIAAGVFADWRAAASACVRIDETLEPDPRSHAAYSALFEVYRDVARDLARHSRRLAALAG
ncbi:MAG: FGGY family carbohydrate kinase, partial [Thermoflexales bacterium]